MESGSYGGCKRGAAEGNGVNGVPGVPGVEVVNGVAQGNEAGVDERGAGVREGVEGGGKGCGGDRGKGRKMEGAVVVESKWPSPWSAGVGSVFVTI